MLFERGLWRVGMKLEDAVEVMAACPDFKDERPSALEQLVHGRGHILLMSPKGHPELAGKGIESMRGALPRWSSVASTTALLRTCTTTSSSPWTASTIP